MKLKEIDLAKDTKFISIFDRFGVEGYNEHSSLEEAIKSLEYGSNEGLIMDIAIIEVKTGDMVWFSDFLGKEECQERVNEIIEEDENNS